MSRRVLRVLSPRFLALALVAVACGPDPRADSFTGAALVHLADQLDRADVRSGAAPEAARQQRVWTFSEPRPDWRTVASETDPALARVFLEGLDDGVRLSLSRPPVQRGPLLIAGLATRLEGLVLGDWETVLVRARSRDRLAGMTVAYNLDEEGALPDAFTFFFATDDAAPVFNDGSEQTYAIPLRPRKGTRPDAALRELGIVLGAPAPAAIDILSVTLVPRGASFLDEYGVRSVARDSVARHSLYAHTPAAISYRLTIGEGGRLDMGLTALAGDAVTYRVRAGEGEASEVLFEERAEGAGPWLQRSVDLSRLAGRTVELVLEAESDRPGSVALWGAPVLSAAGRSERPNVVFYVIDGGGADLMSLYGYNRRTTPFLEELAAEGAVFERAFSNSTWTQPSTASFMTSLHHSVLGGLRRGVHSTPVPAAATTMAEHLRRGGYQTTAFTSNPNAGRIIGLERSVDVLRDVETGHHSTSSVELHERYWRYRDDYPGSPTWVHFQTSDVHEPNDPAPPFAGLFVSPADRARRDEWEGRMFTAAGQFFGTTSITAFYDIALERADVDRRAYFNIRRGLYDETMAHQDRQLARFVERLKARGEWEDTLLIVASDHGHPAGTFARFGRGMFEPQPEEWQGALFDSYATRIPLLFVWPGHIQGGQRFDQPVSMIDVLPTLLDLLGLPRPDVLQGQSLAPLLLGRPLEVRPVILDEFRVVSETGEMTGNLEMIDGRWGASLEIGPQPEGADPTLGRHSVPVGGRWGALHPFFPDAPRLLLYDLWNDPFTLRAVNDQHPELVEHYRELLLRQWEAHRALATRFREAGDVALTPEQLQQLRALGYIQ